MEGHEGLLGRRDKQAIRTWCHQPGNLSRLAGCLERQQVNNCPAHDLLGESMEGISMTVASKFAGRESGAMVETYIFVPAGQDEGLR